MASFRNIMEGFGKVIVFMTLLAGVFGIYYTLTKMGIVFGTVLSMLPFALLFFYFVFSNPYWGLFTVFLVNYFIMGVNRYFPFVPGRIVMDGAITLTFVVCLIHIFQGKTSIKRAFNGLTIVSLIWLFYCIMELMNPLVVSRAAWATTIRGVAIYLFLISIITPIVITNKKDLKRMIFLWSVFSLVAVLKAQIQKSFGFDSYEMRGLYVDGGADTHIIQSGIRYFSFFTDAGNFGSGMGYSMVVFTILSLYVKDIKLKIYYFIVGLLSGYAMMISGTRGALAVPFGGFVMLVIISKNVKAMVGSVFMLAGAYIFLNFTRIGHGNQYIRRMRSAFNKNDPSLVVRLENQKKLRAYMSGKPFGVGVGLGGVKARRYAPYAFASNVPTDSWFVMIWVETGIIGLLLHIGILLYILIYGSYLALFVLKDEELKGYIIALLCGIFGIYVTSYGNEVLGQFPTAIILYMSMAFVFISPTFDSEPD